MFSWFWWLEVADQGASQFGSWLEFSFCLIGRNGLLAISSQGLSFVHVPAETETEAESSGVSSSSYTNTSSIGLGSPVRTSINSISQSSYLQMKPHWGLGLQHMNLRDTVQSVTRSRWPGNRNQSRWYNSWGRWLFMIQTEETELDPAAGVGDYGLLCHTRE